MRATCAGAVVLGAAVAAVAAVALVLVAGAAAADPIGGSWLGAGGQFRDRQHRITESGGALTVTAAEAYAFPEAAACKVAAGRALGEFHYVGAVGASERRYEGTWIAWTVSADGCSIDPPGGQWTAVLGSGEDVFQKPPLPLGPSNSISLYAGAYGTGPLPLSSNFGFVRKSGSATPGGAKVGGAKVGGATGDAPPGPADPAALIGLWTVLSVGGDAVRGGVVRIDRAGALLRVVAGTAFQLRKRLPCPVKPAQLLWLWKPLGKGAYEQIRASKTLSSCAELNATGTQQLSFAAGGVLVATCAGTTIRCDSFQGKALPVEGG
jgi:hypothetical protein